MQEEFCKYIHENRLLREGDKVVIALSGGVDSVVLTDLLSKLGNTCVVAHCNFHLRGEDSDHDEQFVRTFAESLGLDCYVQHFQTEEYAKENGLSIEMAARDLRYAWFEYLRNELCFDKIALAHHADDQIETFFINLLRGAGISGLKGMRSLNGVLIRPLLWATRSQIQDYALKNGLAWREDRTNAETVYLRNKIRNELMPVFDDISLGARKAILRSINYLASENDLYRQFLSSHFLNLIESHDGIQRAPKSIFEGENAFQLLFEWLRDYGFNTDQCDFIFQNLNGQSGKTYFSDSHTLVIERDALELFETLSQVDFSCEIDENTNEIEDPVAISFVKYKKCGSFKINTSQRAAQLDYHKLTFPLTIRKWQNGDRFVPLGMRGSKLLSDYFVDKSFSYVEKHSTWLLLTAKNEIVWVVGNRIDDRFKITKDTSDIFECTLK